MSKETPNLNIKPEAKQITINFESAEVDMVLKEQTNNERKAVAKEYHVLNAETIYKDENGVWRFIIDDGSVEQWDKLMSGNDNSELYNR